jgi:hypothetical protein
MKQLAYHGVQQTAIRRAFVFSLLGIPELDLHFSDKTSVCTGYLHCNHGTMSALRRALALVLFVCKYFAGFVKRATN